MTEMDEAVQRLLGRDLEEEHGRELSQRARQAQRSIETYLAGGIRPRWMERVVDVDAGLRSAERRIGRAYELLRREHADDPAAFAARWRRHVDGLRFDELNELIRQHNAWYPIERDLPMDPRTRDYVQINGRSYRREELTTERILARYPPTL